ncbi:MAG: helix-turn-helix transcriptional regulator [Chloroflexi bacterium]|nr:MAG: helix-turn-helix transcriptional regulator [Chloroflexota bacterium]TME14741.1 MAG: helix-turn-helix transcriptional regulator [Chloroflexota bacterium]TME18580.1 MAG: helix-turn-helix transcriptional regulator [Chloroflexota bacterium]
MEKGAADRIVGLTEAEVQLLKLVSTGRLRPEVAAALGLGPEASAQLRKLHRKGGVRARA